MTTPSPQRPKVRRRMVSTVEADDDKPDSDDSDDPDDARGCTQETRSSMCSRVRRERCQGGGRRSCGG